VENGIVRERFKNNDKRTWQKLKQINFIRIMWHPHINIHYDYLSGTRPVAAVVTKPVPYTGDHYEASLMSELIIQ
jgi:hypothetical protein